MTRSRRTHHAYERRLHARALRMLDLLPGDRRLVIESMYERRHRDTVSYWLQLLVSTGIATVGLVLGSTAVVIGAMLIAPLMGPIVELGMGLVVGSPFLTLRSLGRMLSSLLAVVAGAALLTVLLPFQEVTSEIAMRTAPTALDLLLAVFVAIAAAFTTARPGTDTTSAAAGAAIGIALVPPVCVMGFGLGIRDLEIAGGATLLFLTNLTAILLVSVIFFWILGFERVDDSKLEAEAISRERPNGYLTRALEGVRGIFGSRHGRAIRIGIPLLLVAAVFVPLRTALEQVAWEVRTRGAVSAVMNDVLQSRRAVQSVVSVASGSVRTELFLVGTAAEAGELEREIAARLTDATGVVPVVRVVAVPDADALRQAAGSSSPAPDRFASELGAVREEVSLALRDSWSRELGSLLGWRLEVRDTSNLLLFVDHLGPPMGPVAEVLLGRMVSERIGLDLSLQGMAYSAEPLIARVADGDEWLPAFVGIVGELQQVDRLHVCASIPSDSVADTEGASDILESVRGVAAGAPAGRLSLDSTATQWRAVRSAAPCSASTAGAPGPSPAAASPAAPAAPASPANP